MSSAVSFGVNYGRPESSQGSTVLPENKPSAWSAISTSNQNRRRAATSSNDNLVTVSPGAGTPSAAICKVPKVDSQTVEENRYCCFTSCIKLLFLSPLKLLFM